MPQGIRNLDDLELMVKSYMDFEEFVFDVETFGPYRQDPHRNDVFWISMAGPGRTDVIPMGHPIGERCFVQDDLHRINPSNNHFEERRINPLSGREKWFQIPEPFTPAPKQLWIADVIEVIRPLFFSDRVKCNQNVKFDLLSMAKYFGKVPPPPYACTLVAAKLVDENQYSHRLGDLIKRYFKFEYDKKIGKAVEAYPYSMAYQYSYYDAKATWLLWGVLKKALEKERVRHIFDMEMDLLPVLMDIEQTGVTVDEKALDVLGDEFKLEMAQLQVAINDAAGREINLNANRQVAWLVYDHLGKICKEYTKTGQQSTSRETLEAYNKNSTVKAILEHGALKKLVGTFVTGLKKTIVDGVVHPDFNQVGAVSGRLSARNPNVQQMPSRSERSKRVRQVFIARPGKMLIVSDLSQIELRMLAHLSGDRRLIQAYLDNEDLHAITARSAFGPDFTSIQRTFAKNVNFALLYGAGPTTVVRRYGVPSVELASDLMNSFYRNFPRVKPWKREVLDAAVANRDKRNRVPAHVTTILGRRRRLPELLSEDMKKRSAAERQAISVTISGSAADLFKLAMIQCQSWLNEAAWEGHILMTVHDELVVEVPERFADEGLTLVREAMENIVNPLTGDPILSVPIVAEAKAVKSWADAK